MGIRRRLTGRGKLIRVLVQLTHEQKFKMIMNPKIATSEDKIQT
jgi:hypothetical protein